MLTSEEGPLSKSEDRTQDLLLLEVITGGRGCSVKVESEKLFKQECNKTGIKGMF